MPAVPQGTILTLLGPVPSKKNLWKHGRGHSYIPEEVTEQINSLTLQAKSQWRRKPVEHPNITIQFYVTSRRQDRDNMVTTILDCLTKGGVLVNDNIARCNGMLSVVPAVVVKQYERTVVGISW